MASGKGPEVWQWTGCKWRVCQGKAKLGGCKGVANGEVPKNVIRMRVVVIEEGSRVWQMDRV